MKGDVTLTLKAKREIEKLIADILAYHTEGIEDDYGETEAERKAASFRHEDFDILHETVLDPKDPLQKGCPQCGSINRLRRIEALLREASAR